MAFNFSYNNQPVQQQGQVEAQQQASPQPQSSPQFDLSQQPPQATPDNYQINYDTVEQQASPQTQQEAQPSTLNTNFGVSQQTQTVEPIPVDTTTVNPQDVTLNVTPINNIQASPQTQEQPTLEQPTQEQPTQEQPTQEQPTQEQPTQEQPTLSYHTATCDGISVGLVANQVVDVTQLNNITKITYGKGKYKLDIPMGTQEINAKNYTLVNSYVANPVAFVNNTLVLEITTLLTSQYNQTK